MAVLRRNIEHAKRVFFDRLGNPYVYGGMWNPHNFRQGTDCCLVGETMVYGPDGAKPIAELAAGDLVYVYDGGKRETSIVEAQWRSVDQPVFRVRTRGRSVTASANHPFLRVRLGGGAYHQRDVCAEWVRTDELRPGDFLLSPKSLSQRKLAVDHLPDGRALTVEIAWLLGLLTGDGSLTGTKLIRCCVYGDVRGRARAALAELSDAHVRVSDSEGLALTDTRLVSMLDKLGMRRGSANKRIPDGVWSWSPEHQRAFLDGYCDADGHRPSDVAKHGERTYSSVSRRLIEDVRALHVILGDSVSNIAVNRRTKPITIKGKVVGSARPLHTFAVWRGRKADRYKYLGRSIGRWIEETDFVLSKVLEITPEGVRPTYDITVKGDHNFIADGLVVHNSGLWNDILAAVTTGAVRWGREAEGATTESYRPTTMGGPIPIGGRGPFGVIVVARPQDVPRDAVVKLGLKHGPGGGAASHMWGEVDGVRMESAGSKGTVTQPDAWPWDHSYANSWAYLPGPIVEDGTPVQEPQTPTTTWGIDISNHQGVVDLNRVKAEGFDFVWAKVSEGANYRDPFWPRTRDDAKALGLILAGYHYIRAGDPVAQARLFVDHLGDKTIPAMLDFEEGSGDISQFWAVKGAIEAQGVRVALSYIPDWYWERIGKPDLSKVPGLIASEYVSGSDYASRLYPGNNSPLWKSYGGRTPDILQFTDRALVAGKSMDANAFRGTPDQLRALLGGQPIGDDDPLSKLTDAQVDRLNKAVDKILGGGSMPAQWPSRGMFAPVDEKQGGVDDTVGMLLNTDGNGWNIVMIVGALLGVERDVQAIRDNAEGRFPAGMYHEHNEWLRKRAQEFAQKLLPLCGFLSTLAPTDSEDDDAR